MRRFVDLHGVEPQDWIFAECLRKWGYFNGRPDWARTALCIDMRWNEDRGLYPDRM